MKAEKPEARQLTDAERKRIREREESTFRELRLFLRDVINKLGRDRKFAMFAKPVDITEVNIRFNIHCSVTYNIYFIIHEIDYLVYRSQLVMFAELKSKLILLSLSLIGNFGLNSIINTVMTSL